MTIKNLAHDVIETDFLVIGGGVGGPFAALFASEGGAKVVLLDKADVRRSGSLGVGIYNWHQTLTPEISIDDVAKAITNRDRKYIGTRGLLPNNKGVADENLLFLGYKDNWETVEALERWGFSMKWDDGQYFFQKGLDNMHFHGGLLKKGLARALKNSPVTVLQRTMAVDLLCKDGKVTGATAFNVRTGAFTVCKAKAVILATGKLSRMFNPWHYMSPGKFKMLYHYHAGSGDGMAMAIKAGAELINMEVGGIGSGIWGSRLADKLHPSHYPYISGKVYDGMGNLFKDADKEGWFDVDELFKLEREGRGPCFADATHLPEEWHRTREDFIHDSFPIHLKFIKERGMDTRKDRFEVAHYRPEFTSAITGISYDKNGRTSVEGLYTCGDTAGGSIFVGAANAAVFGMRAGRHVAENITKVKHTALDEEQVDRQKEMVFSPKTVKKGVEPLEVEVKIRDIVERYCGPERSEGSINQGLWRLKSVKERFLPELVARDNHELMSAIEVRNLFLMAEIYMLCSRERRESGMRTFRLDFPDKTNDPWREAIITRMENGEIRFIRRKMAELNDENKEIK